MTLLSTYDARRLRSPHEDEPDPIGTEDGDGCNRYVEPDEDAPRGYKPRPCRGIMQADPDDPAYVVCDVCGEIERTMI